MKAGAKLSLSPLVPSPPKETKRIKDYMEAHIIGQGGTLEPILNRLSLFHSGLAASDRTVGNFLMLGPTGTGKTRTVEALAEALHGSRTAMVKIDCGEFQMEHEVAKLIGAPPGYLGHRETMPALSQQKITTSTSDKSPISIVLFDEIEKAAPSMSRLLLGILDKATLRLGDNSIVNFNKSLIFLTSNLGAKGMLKLINPTFGFESSVLGGNLIKDKIESIGMEATKRHFSPEFVNRLDHVLTYIPLETEEITKILDLELEEVSKRIRGSSVIFELNVSPSVKDLLIKEGISKEFGARNLKRVIDRRLVVPLSALINGGQIVSGNLLTADLGPGGVEFFVTGDMIITPKKEKK